jgi:hypothetical protein
VELRLTHFITYLLAYKFSAIAQRFELQTEEAEKKKVEDEERRKRTLERKTSMAAVTVKNNITPAVKAKQDVRIGLHLFRVVAYFGLSTDLHD